MRTLTEPELVAELHARGLSHISQRMVAGWRRTGLLPDFDQRGRSLGRGAGREPNTWLRAEAIIDQAIWVDGLLKIYGSMDDLYVPQLLLGYPVSPEHVRAALTRPFDEFIEYAAREMSKPQSRISLEDFLDDLAERACLKGENRKWRFLQVPQSALEAFANTLVNDRYDLDGTPFEEGVQRLRAWERACRKDFPNFTNDVVATFLLQHAAFIQRHLSFGRMKEAVETFTESDLRAVQNDLALVKQIASLIAQAVELLLPEANEELKDNSFAEWRSLFALGEVFILVDLALRRSGFGPVIDLVLPDLLQRLQSEMTVDMEQEMIAAKPNFISSVQAGVQQMLAKAGGS